MILEWFSRETVIGTVHVLCDQHGNACLKITPLSRGRFLKLNGLGLMSNYDVVVPAISLETDYDKQQFEKYVLRTLWRTQSESVLITVQPFNQMALEDDSALEEVPDWPEALSAPFGEE